MSAWPGIIEGFKEFLPVTARTPKLTLLEGNTPLIPAPKISKHVGVHVYLKFEGLNPTGSFKDRGMVLAVAKAVEDGKNSIICASTGNTSASAAAYAARAGLRCFVVIPSGKVALGKLSQALIYGAKVIPIDGNFDDALAFVRRFVAKHPIALVNSVNPFRIEGQKTAAFEVEAALGKAPDYVALPVGNGGNITAYWKGFRELKNRKGSGLPKMLGFQAEGAAPLVLGKPVAQPQTIATAIRIGNPASWEGAKAALNESSGDIRAVSDRQILEAYQILAGEEGVFAEPASAAPIAGVMARAREQKFDSRETVVCVLTGNGLKDPGTALSLFEGFENAQALKIDEVEDVIFGQPVR